MIGYAKTEKTPTVNLDINLRCGGFAKLGKLIKIGLIDAEKSKESCANIVKAGSIEMIHASLDEKFNSYSKGDKSIFDSAKLPKVPVTY